MHLDAMIEGLGLTLLRGSGGTLISDLTDDSRQVKDGTLFVARDAKYVPAAVAAGAAAVISDQSADDSGVAWVQAGRVDQAMAGMLAERFFGGPASKLKLIAITGTNGKTTTAYVCQHLLTAAGVRCGLIGTVAIDDGKTRHVAELTTPGAIDLSRLLAAMAANGCEAAVMEASSHALVQGRTQALSFDAAIYTNLTGDHLDYHGDMETYLGAKKILFDQLPPEGVAVLNVDDAYAERIIADCRGKVVRCSATDAEADYFAKVEKLAADHSRILLRGPGGESAIALPLPGMHNVMNAMQALAATAAVERRVKAADLARCPGVPGRLERVNAGDGAGPTVLVDYAHTHDALENVLRALRPITKGRLRVLFGCGGDRDRTKRPKMARAACELADDVIVTSDNPRTEEPQAIIAEILTGVPAGRGDLTVEPDRAKAIAMIIATAAASDVVLLAGKGHEDYQIIGKTKRHFDDREEAAKALAARGKSQHGSRV